LNFDQITPLVSVSPRFGMRGRTKLHFLSHITTTTTTTTTTSA